MTCRAHSKKSRDAPRTSTDWGYVGEGGGKVSIYHNGQPVLRHIPDREAIDKLLELIGECHST